MATRDLTKAFMEYRTAAQHRRRRTGGGGGGEGGGGGAAVRRALAPRVGGGTSRALENWPAAWHCQWLREIGWERTAASICPDQGEDSGYKQLTAGGLMSSSDHDLALLDEEEGGGGGIQLTSTRKHLKEQAFSASPGPPPPPPAWVKHVDSVEQTLRDIRAQMDHLQSMHSTRLGSVFGRDLTTMEAKIEQLTLQITGRFREAERSLQAIGALTRGGGGSRGRNTSAQDALVGANVQRSLAQQLQELSVQFRQSQRKYLAEVQAQKSGGLVPTSTSAVDGSGGGGEFFTSSQQQQMTMVDDMTVMIQSRDQEIVQIAKSIEELGSIFKELAVLVIDQGTILDRIDYNMEAVVESTKTGIKQLEKAEQHQKNARPLRCIICLSLTIFVLLVILILKHRPRRGWF